MSNTSYDPWLIIKADMLNGLYTTQILHWNTKLAEIIQRNAQLLGTALSLPVARTAAIQYKNKSWTALPLNWLSDVTIPPNYNFPLCSSDPELESRLEKVTNEMQKIKHERYESDRFMSSLNMYGLSGNQLHQILGDHLYRVIAKNADSLFCDSDKIFHPVPLNEFLARHSKILDHMQERVMVNYLMTDILR